MNGSMMRDFIRTALLPVGFTLYVWGGGWNFEDTGAGSDGMRIGVNPQWKEFFYMQKADYDFRDHRYEHGNGLDCSGYMGWVLNNTLSKVGLADDYVKKAGWQPQMLSRKGLGIWCPAEKVTDWKTGDIMGSFEEGHIFLVLKKCRDNSLLICHSSPPGVQVNGTSDSAGNRNSIAVRTARQYMLRKSPEWCRRYHDFWKDEKYLTNYDQFRWNDF